MADRSARLSFAQPGVIGQAPVVPLSAGRVARPDLAGVPSLLAGLDRMLDAATRRGDERQRDAARLAAGALDNAMGEFVNKLTEDPSTRAGWVDRARRAGDEILDSVLEQNPDLDDTSRALLRQRLAAHVIQVDGRARDERYRNAEEALAIDRALGEVGFGLNEYLGQIDRNGLSGAIPGLEQRFKSLTEKQKQVRESLSPQAREKFDIALDGLYHRGVANVRQRQAALAEETGRAGFVEAVNRSGNVMSRDRGSFDRERARLLALAGDLGVPAAVASELIYRSQEQAATDYWQNQIQQNPEATETEGFRNDPLIDDGQVAILEAGLRERRKAVEAGRRQFDAARNAELGVTVDTASDAMFSGAQADWAKQGQAALEASEKRIELAVASQSQARVDAAVAEHTRLQVDYKVAETFWQGVDELRQSTSLAEFDTKLDAMTREGFMAQEPFRKRVEIFRRQARTARNEMVMGHLLNGDVAPLGGRGSTMLRQSVEQVMQLPVPATEGGKPTGQTRALGQEIAALDNLDRRLPAFGGRTGLETIVWLSDMAGKVPDEIERMLETQVDPQNLANVGKLAQTARHLELKNGAQEAFRPSSLMGRLASWAMVQPYLQDKEGGLRDAIAGRTAELAAPVDAADAARALRDRLAPGFWGNLLQMQNPWRDSLAGRELVEVAQMLSARLPLLKNEADGVSSADPALRADMAAKLLEQHYGMRTLRRPGMGTDMTVLEYMPPQKLYPDADDSRGFLASLELDLKRKDGKFRGTIETQVRDGRPFFSDVALDPRSPDVGEDGELETFTLGQAYDNGLLNFTVHPGDERANAGRPIYEVWYVGEFGQKVTLVSDWYPEPVGSEGQKRLDEGYPVPPPPPGPVDPLESGDASP